MTRFPDHADVPYGPHPRQVFDLWQAQGAGPAPFYLFIHGGGYCAGDKSMMPSTLLEALLAAGVACIASWAQTS